MAGGWREELLDPLMGDTEDLGRVTHGKVSVSYQSACGGRLRLRRPGCGKVRLGAGPLGIPNGVHHGRW